MGQREVLTVHAFSVLSCKFLVQMCIALTIKRDVALSAFVYRSAQEMQKQI